MANSKLAMAGARLEGAQMDLVIELEQQLRVMDWQRRRIARRLTALVNAGNDAAALRAAKERLQTVG